MIYRDETHKLVGLGVVLVAVLGAGCGGKGRLNDDSALPVEARACVQAQRDERQWCTPSVTHGLQATQFRCLDAKRRVEDLCMSINTK